MRDAIDGNVTDREQIDKGLDVIKKLARVLRPGKNNSWNIEAQILKPSIIKKIYQNVGTETQQPAQQPAQRFDGEERYRVAIAHARNDQQFVTKFSGLKYKSDFAEQVIDYFNTHPGNDKTDLVFLYRELDDFLTLKESSRILKGILG